MVWGVVVAHVVCSFEGFQELLEDLLLSFLSSLDIWMSVSCVNSADIIDVNEATTVFVHDSESLGNNSLTVLVHWSTNSSEELVILDKTTSVIVHVSEKSLDLTLGESEHIVGHGLRKFKFIERHRMIIIHNPELLCKSNDSTGSTGGKLGSQFRKEVFS